MSKVSISSAGDSVLCIVVFHRLKFNFCRDDTFEKSAAKPSLELLFQMGFESLTFFYAFPFKSLLDIACLVIEQGCPNILQ